MSQADRNNPTQVPPPSGGSGSRQTSEADATPDSPLSRKSGDLRYVGRFGAAAAIAAAALLGAWYGWRTYRAFPLRELPAVDLSRAPAAVKTAILNAESAVRASPRSGKAWGELGLFLQAHQFFGEANACLAQAMRFDTGEALWAYSRGSMLSVRNPPESERCFRLVARIRPDMALPRLRLGELFLEQRRLDEANSEFLEANRIEPENARALLGLALVAYAEGNLGKARDWAEQSFERDPEQRTTAELLLRIFHRLGDKEAAERVQAQLDRMPAGERGWDDPFTEKMLLMRRDPAGLAQAADELIVKGRLPEAIRMLEQLVKSAPETPQWTVMLARTLNHAGNYRRSAQVLDTALARHPDSADLQFQRGVVHLFRQEWEPGAARFRRAIELKSDFSDAWYNLGQSLKHLDDRTGAIAAFREAIRFKPDYAAAYANLGELLLDAGENDAAREALETAARLAPSDAGIKRSLERLRM